MAERKAVVIAIDGLRASALGAYGNTSHPTPALDELAAQSVVIDWMYRESPDLAAFYQSAWDDGSLPRRLTDSGVAISLVTDDAAVAERASTMSLADVCSVEIASDPHSWASADDAANTALASLMAVAAEQLQKWLHSEGSDSRLLWIHARGYFGPWDAPLELRADLLEEGDPDAPTFVAPPQFEATNDHDALLTHRVAYAAQTVVLDECVAGFLAALTEAGLDNRTLVALVGCRGFALGEHGAVGSDVAALYGELLHIPCLLRIPGSAPAPLRWPHLATVGDLHATLAAWFDPGALGSLQGSIDLLSDDVQSSGDAAVRQFVRATGDRGERSLRTPSWMLRQSPAANCELAGAVELFVKPDDRWEANEVAARCPEVVEELLATLDHSGDSEPA